MKEKKEHGSLENSLSFFKAREQIDSFFKNKEPYTSPLSEEETKLILERKALQSPVAELNFWMKLTRSLLVNPKTGQAPPTQYTVPSLLDLSLFKVKAMKIDGQLSEELLKTLPEDLAEKLNNPTPYRKGCNPGQATI